MLLKSLYISDQWAAIVAKLYLSREDIKVSDVVMNVLEISNVKEVKEVLEEIKNKKIEKKNAL